MTGYRTEPIRTAGNPPGLPFIVANEAAERFSYYGMRAVLVIFMTQHLTDSSGASAPLSEAEAKGWFHLFVAASYFTPILGAILADAWLGKFRTIVILSLVYCLGHVALSLDATLMGLLFGQSLIALGAGGIKPCVSAHLGDQFADTNRHLLGRAYSIFYFAINLGAFAAMLTTPWLMEHEGPWAAFGLPAVLMFAATLIFWSGRWRFAHIPPAGLAFARQGLAGDGLKTLGRLASLYVCVAVFWSLFDQTGSSWVLQAQSMDRLVSGVELLPSQMQAANPALIMLLVPLFQFVVYPALDRPLGLTPLRKIGIGMLLATASFAMTALIQHDIDLGGHPWILWQLLAYVTLTAGEVMVSITCLEFSYAQAPKVMKSFIMALYMASVAAGNLFTGVFNMLLDGAKEGSLLSGAGYFWFFTALMLLSTGLFALLANRYPETAPQEPKLG